MRPFPPAVALGVLTLAWLSFSTDASAADVATATETFRTGTAAFARKDYRAAALSFELSNKLVPAAAASYNAGLAWQEAGEKARAADDYLEALGRPREELSDAERKDATSRLAELRKTYGWVVVDGQGVTVTVAHADRRAAPARVHLAPGEHELTLEHPGSPIQRVKVQVVVGVEVRAERARDEPGPAPPPKAGASGLFIGPQRGAGIGLGVAAVVIGAVAVGTGVAALDARDAFFASGLYDVGAHDRADALRAVTNVAWVTAGACLLAGVIVFATAPGKKAEAVARRVGPTLQLSF